MIRSDDDGRTVEEVIEDSQFLIVAFHEAGHAVVGHRLGYHLDSIRVWPEDETFSGEAVFSEMPEDEEDAAIVTAAGAAAHAMRQKLLFEHNERARYRGEARIRHMWFPPDLSRDDDRAFCRYLERNYFTSGPGRKREIRRVTARAEKLVEEHWDAIVDVVRALEAAWDEKGEVFMGRSAFLRAIGEAD